MRTVPRRLAFTFIRRAVLMLGVWLIVSEFALSGLPFGLCAAIGAAAVSLRVLPPRPAGFAPLRFLILWPSFLGRSVMAGFDVARRAVSPGPPVLPGWVEHESALPEGPPRTLFGAEISLLPGTLSAGTRSGRLHVHALDMSQETEAQLETWEAELQRAFPRKYRSQSSGDAK